MRPRKIQTLSSINVEDQGTEGSVRRFTVQITTAATILALADFLAENGAYHTFSSFLKGKIQEALEEYVRGVDSPLSAARKNFEQAKKEPALIKSA